MNGSNGTRPAVLVNDLYVRCTQTSGNVLKVELRTPGRSQSIAAITMTQQCHPFILYLIQKCRLTSVTKTTANFTRTRQPKKLFFALMVYGRLYPGVAAQQTGQLYLRSEFAFKFKLALKLSANLLTFFCSHDYWKYWDFYHPLPKSEPHIGLAPNELLSKAKVNPLAEDFASKITQSRLDSTGRIQVDSSCEPVQKRQLTLFHSSYPPSLLVVVGR